MLPFVVFLVLALIAVSVIDVLIKGMFVLTVIAAILLALTVGVGGWTMARRRNRV